jgi:hypothetical protein
MKAPAEEMGRTGRTFKGSEAIGRNLAKEKIQEAVSY